jgi:hypothetical protein
MIIRDCLEPSQVGYVYSTGSWQEGSTLIAECALDYSGSATPIVCMAGSWTIATGCTPLCGLTVLQQDQCNSLSELGSTCEVTLSYVVTRAATDVTLLVTSLRPEEVGCEYADQKGATVSLLFQLPPSAEVATINHTLVLRGQADMISDGNQTVAVSFVVPNLCDQVIQVTTVNFDWLNIDSFAPSTIGTSAFYRDVLQTITVSGSNFNGGAPGPSRVG